MIPSSHFLILLPLPFLFPKSILLKKIGQILPTGESFSRREGFLLSVQPLNSFKEILLFKRQPLNETMVNVTSFFVENAF